MSSEDPLIEQRSYTPQETGYLRQHNPSPYSTFDQPSATQALPTPPSPGTGTTYTTTTTWTFPKDADPPSKFPGMEEAMGLVQPPYQSKYEKKQAKLQAKEDQKWGLGSQPSKYEQEIAKLKAKEEEQMWQQSQPSSHQAKYEQKQAKL